MRCVCCNEPTIKTRVGVPTCLPCQEVIGETVLEMKLRKYNRYGHDPKSEIPTVDKEWDDDST